MAALVPSHYLVSSITSGLALSALLVFPAHSQAPMPPVTVAKPVSKKITQWDDFSGRFEVIESVNVRARVSGFIEKVHFKDGQMVKEGDLLFIIDKRPFQIAVESAQAEIAQRKADVALKICEVERPRPLLRSRTLTQRDFETRDANLAIARARLAAAEATLRW